MPLVRPAFAALVVLEFTLIYNDFFWALLLMKSGERRPITSALNNLKGNFFMDNNLLAAGAIIVALPTMIVFFAPRSSSSAACRSAPRRGSHAGGRLGRSGPGQEGSELMTPRPWADPELIARGRLPMHAVPHGDRLSARRHVAVPAAACPGRGRRVTRGARSRSPAPGRCRTPGTGRSTPTSRCRSPIGPPEVPAENPTGVYERTFELPDAWAGRRVVLHVGAAESVLIVELNGAEVGVSKDSHLAAEFDLTDRAAARASTRCA